MKQQYQSYGKSKSVINHLPSIISKGLCRMKRQVSQDVHQRCYRQIQQEYDPANNGTKRKENYVQLQRRQKYSESDYPRNPPTFHSCSSSEKMLSQKIQQCIREQKQFQKQMDECLYEKKQLKIKEEKLQKQEEAYLQMIIEASQTGNQKNSKFYREAKTENHKKLLKVEDQIKDMNNQITYFMAQVQKVDWRVQEYSTKLQELRKLKH